MPLPEALITEATRQLNICNACRYCEGYCAVFPALERRVELTGGDVEYLANLCHDCRDCYYACPYIPPHTFAVNPPELFSIVRRASYEASLPLAAPERPTASRHRNMTLAVAVVTGIILILVGVTNGLGSLFSHATTSGSPYRVISYPYLIALAIVASAWSIGVFIVAAHRYAKRSGSSLAALLAPSVSGRALRYSAELRYMSGGGAGCAYPKEQARASRKMLHFALAYGFVLCFASTISAGILQDLAGREPPYAIVSVPVPLGVVGGAGIIVGALGLIAIKPSADRAPGDRQMAVRDYGLLISLTILAVTGLITLVVRHSEVFGLALAVHLAAVITAIVLAPYSKFLHAPFRFLAIAQDNREARSA